MSGKILVTIPYWSGDAEMAFAVAKLLADLEPAMSVQADILFNYRFDADPPPADIISATARKFFVHTYRCPRRSVGWPNACNDQWFSSIEWAWSMQNAKKVPRYKALFWVEPDCCPLVPKWLDWLHASWDKARVKVLGPESHDGRGHPIINGTALYSCEESFLYWISREVGAARREAWDTELAPEFFKRGASHLWGYGHRFRTPTIYPDQYERDLFSGLKFLHGIKDDSLIRLVRKKFNLPPI